MRLAHHLLALAASLGDVRRPCPSWLETPNDRTRVVCWSMDHRERAIAKRARKAARNLATLPLVESR